MCFKNKCRERVETSEERVMAPGRHFINLDSEPPCCFLESEEGYGSCGYALEECVLYERTSS